MQSYTPEIPFLYQSMILRNLQLAESSGKILDQWQQWSDTESKDFNVSETIGITKSSSVRYKSTSLMDNLLLIHTDSTTLKFEIRSIKTILKGLITCNELELELGFELLLNNFDIRLNNIEEFETLEEE